MESSALEEKQGEREARFAWYYMTTTVTSTSTMTATSTTYTGTYTGMGINEL